MRRLSTPRTTHPGDAAMNRCRVDTGQKRLDGHVLSAVSDWLEVTDTTHNITTRRSDFLVDTGNVATPIRKSATVISKVSDSEACNPYSEQHVRSC